MNAEQPAPTPAEEWPDIEFAIRSQPPGAKVREGDHTLCTTPCNVRHPSWAPETRSLVLELDAHEPLSLEVHHDDLTYDVALVPVPVTRPRPKPPTRPAPARKPPPKPKTKLRLSR